jgi:hypothetical protein
MIELWVALVFAASPVEPAPGSLLFLEHSNKAVERFTEGEISHVAIVLQEQGETVVYEATPPRVRKVGWNSYLVELARLNEGRDDPMVPHLASPDRPWTEAELELMRAMGEVHLGQPYSIKGHLRNRAADGVHCAEFATMCLQTAERFPDEPAYRMTPQSLYDRTQEFYRPAEEVSLAEVVVPKTGWTENARWRWSGYWNWCKWSCWESWGMCW